ncbi:MAG: GntR family transcriptional regulator [Dysgonamonadaceae bacterium]|nr:GntR family transcriptional regulator [Dysgonamonadaceae bacterium]
MKIALDHSSHIPLYIQIEDHIRNMIQEPEYKKEKKKLPNEIDFSRQLGVSRNTMRQAINKLVYEGLLVRKKGIGTVVADAAITSKAGNWMSFSQEMKTLGIEIKNYELYVGWVKPPKDICRFFEIEEEAKILKLERLRGNPEHPFVYFISYFNPRIGLNGNEDFSRPLYEILEKDYHIIVKLSKEEISALLADSSLAEKLEIKAGDPILKRKRFVFDPGGRPVEWNVGYYRADSFVYTIESEREI